MKVTERHLINQAIDQEPTKRLRCMLVHSQIFIEMKSRHARPIDLGCGGEIREKLVLRRRRGEYHNGFAVVLNRTPDLRCDYGRGGLAHLRSRLVDVDVELARAKVSLQSILHCRRCLHVFRNLVGILFRRPSKLDLQFGRRSFMRSVPLRGSGWVRSRAITCSTICPPLTHPLPRGGTDLMTRRRPGGSALL